LKDYQPSLRGCISLQKIVTWPWLFSVVKYSHFVAVFHYRKWLFSVIFWLFSENNRLFSATSWLYFTTENNHGQMTVATISEKLSTQKMTVALTFEMISNVSTLLYFASRNACGKCLSADFREFVL